MKGFIKILAFSTVAFCATGQYIVNDALKKITLQIADITVSGPVGTAYETVDHYSSFIIDQNTPDITLSLPAPTDTTWGDDVTVRNTGSTPFWMYGVRVPIDSFEIHLTWKRGAWRLVGGYAVQGATGGGGDPCNCCDSLLFFPNDTAAHNQGWFNKGDYYLLSADNSYGYAWGIVRKIIQDVGFIEQSNGSPTGLDGGILGIDTNVGFKGRSPRCKFIPPENVLPYYASDTLAKVDLDDGDFYMCSVDNVYGMPLGAIKKIVEP
ncbi:MAG: hypothetical protein IPM42_22195 [Saprospiraceae bacterium]|nr:hypothetical protein [Saprospiraceae bacterium]